MLLKNGGNFTSVYKDTLVDVIITKSERYGHPIWTAELEPYYDNGDDSIYDIPVMSANSLEKLYDILQEKGLT